jgi:hypothetical protein
MWAQSPENVSRLLRRVASPDLTVRADAFYALLIPSPVDTASFRNATVAFVGGHASQREQIKTALISALNQNAAYRSKRADRGEGLSEQFLNYWADLLSAVGALNDIRAVRGLLAALDTGGTADEALNDLCPESIDEIIKVYREASKLSTGEDLRQRTFAVAALGGCLQRPAAMRRDGTAGLHARDVLVAALDDPAGEVRGAAVSSLTPLRAEPDVRARLAAVVRKDAFVRNAASGEQLRTVEPPEHGTRYGVREAAAYVLSLPLADGSFFVMRKPENLECRVQRTDEGETVERFIGPFMEESQAIKSMCGHADSKRESNSGCWVVTPAAVCTNR